MTEKLYYEDGYVEAFEAEVLSCEPEREGYAVVLDRTAFFPEGGGQYADTGALGEARVLDVRERGGVICHFTDRPFSAGEKVAGKLDWEKRFESMQQHTGEHIVSGIVHGWFGYDNVGFHLGKDSCTLDFNGPLTKQHLREAEQRANRVVWDNVAVRASCPSREMLKGMAYRSKIEIEGQVRIVEIPGVDTCACCAPHVMHTGEIGLIKLVDMANYKGGVRIHMFCGSRALRDYAAKDGAAKEISALLCAKELEIAEAVKHLKEEHTQLKGKIVELQRRMIFFQAQETEITDGVTVVFDEGLSGDGPRELMNLLLERGAKVSAVFAGTEKEGYRYAIGSRTEDVRPVCRKLNGAFGGKGGGRPEMVQGALKGEEPAIREMLL